MLRTVGLKLVHLVPVLFLVSLGTFFLLELVPGDPAVAVLGPDATPQQYAAVHKELGLDKPLVQRYFDWLGNTLRGDLGKSLKPPVQNVSDMIASRLPVTLEITILALGMALVVAIPLALGAAYRANGRFDRITSGAAFGAISVPSFLGGLADRLPVRLQHRPRAMAAARRRIGTGAVARMAHVVARRVTTRPGGRGHSTS